MIRLILLALWTSAITFGASYLTANWKTAASAEAASEEPFFEGLEYRTLPAVTVPMIRDGRVDGYVVARFVFTADARSIREFPIDIGPILSDEAFRQLYEDNRADFRHLEKYDLEALGSGIKTRINARLGQELVNDVLIDRLDYVDPSMAGR